MDEKLYKINSVMLGHAVADALGVPVEFCERDELRKEPVTDMIGYGTYPFPAGFWSDDTSMSLATLDSLADGKPDYNDIMVKFGMWYYSDEYTPNGEMFDVGNTCSEAIERYCRQGKSVDECGLTGERANGNGSLMRIHPVCLYLFFTNADEDKAAEIIHRTSALTHAHMRSKIGCEIYYHVLRGLLEKPSIFSVRLALDKARRACQKSEEFQHYDRMLLKRIGRIYSHCEEPNDYIPLTEDDIKSSGYIVHTLEAATWCLLTTHSYKDCVLKAVNLGDDTDTVAAVAGGLAGALYGYDAIPPEWLNKLAKRDYIEEMCEKAAQAWLPFDRK